MRLRWRWLADEKVWKVTMVDTDQQFWWTVDPKRGVIANFMIGMKTIDEKMWGWQTDAIQ